MKVQFRTVFNQRAESVEFNQKMLTVIGLQPGNT